MDLRIEIKNENGEILQLVVVYQDGSDSEGAQKIADFIRAAFTVDESEWANLPRSLRPHKEGHTTKRVNFDALAAQVRADDKQEG